MELHNEVTSKQESAWLWTRLVAAVLAAMCGWYDSSDYFGAIPAPIKSIGMALSAALLVGWVLKEPASAEQVSESKTFWGGILTSGALFLLMRLVGYSPALLWAGAFFAFIGGIATIIYPKWAIGGAAIGAILGLVEALTDIKIHGLIQHARVVDRHTVVFGLFLPLLWAGHFKTHSGRKKLNKRPS
jgi:hypothetical protein